MIGVFIYVDGVAHRIDLFKDESISITSSIQNFRDLGKIFTDYSKSFTIPASSTNNRILKHWYNSEVGATSLDNQLNVDGAFDHRISYYGYIEIDGTFFRNGKFILKGSAKKKNRIENYKIDFKGNLVQLKERFKDDKLNSLSEIVDDIRVSLYDELNHSWNLSEVQSRVTNFNNDILYPIIGTKRKLYLNSGVPSQDISHTSGKLMFNEIFPALRVTKILEYIQTAYGITFDGAFIESQTFSKLYMYLKNQDEFVLKPQQLMIDFTSKDTTTQILDNFGAFVSTESFGFDDLDLTTNAIAFDKDFLPFFAPYVGELISVKTRRLELKITTASANSYNIYVYNNGILYTSFENVVGTQTKTIIPNEIFNNSSTVYNFTFFVASEQGITFTSELKQIVSVRSPFDIDALQYQVVKGYSASQTTVSSIDIKSFIPDITVEGFMAGLIKQFNLMVIPTSETSFYLQTLNDYYADGKVWDLTKYVDANEISIDPPQLYKKVEFKYQKSPNILNEYFRGLFNKEYGDLNFENVNSAFSETYTVELPFENFMFERETGTDFITATIFDKDTKPYVPKPTLIYCNGLQVVTPSIKISNGTSTNDIPDYVRFSNELALAGSDVTYTQSLNWGAEISSWDLNINFTGLYQKFYSKYIENLFNQRTRIIKIKARLPITVLCFLSLKDKIIISNKRYIINTMTPDLKTKETQFELILDNNDLNENAEDRVLRLSNIQQLTVDNTKQDIELQIFLKDYDIWRSKIATGFLSGKYDSGGNIYKDGLMTVQIPDNTSGVPRTDAILIEYFKGSDSITIAIPVVQNA